MWSSAYKCRAVQTPIQSRWYSGEISRGLDVLSKGAMWILIRIRLSELGEWCPEEGSRSKRVYTFVAFLSIPLVIGLRVHQWV